MAVKKQGPVPYEVVEKERAVDLFVAPKKEAVWADVVSELLLDRSVFIPNMTRVQRETLRSIIRYRRYGTLRSRTVERDDKSGMLLRLDRGMKK